MIKFILMDVEGTTTDISFVHETLFPYAREKMDSFVRANYDGLEDIAAATKTDSPEELVKLMTEWIDEDRKEPALKSIQGRIWREGYESGELKGHVYEEVPAVWESWKGSGLELGIYSSGSVEAQKLIYGHSVAGNLSSFLSKHYDLAVGNKREVSSYQRILEDLKIPGEQVLFLSDVEEELDAAFEAGMKTIRVFRDGTGPSKHSSVEDFAQINLAQL